MKKKDDTGKKEELPGWKNGYRTEPGHFMEREIREQKEKENQQPDDKETGEDQLNN